MKFVGLVILRLNWASLGGEKHRSVAACHIFDSIRIELINLFQT